MASQRIGTFVVSDHIWQNQSELFRTRFWSRILRVTWDEQRYWITAESKLFDPIQTGEVIPDYAVSMMGRRGRRDVVTVTRQRIRLAVA